MEPDDSDEQPISARHLMVCREVLYDPLDVEAPYSLRGVIHFIRPDADYGYPLCMEVLALYTQLFGRPGRYLVRIELAQISEDGSPVNDPRELRGPTPVRVRPGAFVDGAWFVLTRTVFHSPGLYEFRIVLDGFEEPLISERIYLMEI